jgi:hypothetical protein
MTARQVRVTLPVGETRVHRFQVVREHREDGSHEDWIVVDFPPEGVGLASLDFEWHRTVPVSAVEDGTIEPLVESGVPVWGY